MPKIKNKVTARQAKLDDFDSIVQIQKIDGFKHAYYLTKGRIDRLIKRGEIFFLAFIKNDPVGFISVDLEIRAKLHFFSIKKQYWNKGVGTTLYQRVREESKKHGCKTLFIYVEVDSPVEKFLLNRGMKKVGYYKNRYAQGRDANILAVEL